MQRNFSRRDVLKTSAAAIGSTVFAQPLSAAAPQATPLTPALIEAARKEGKIAFYSALELNVSEKLARAFEAKYPGVSARVERSGAERVFPADQSGAGQPHQWMRSRVQHRSGAFHFLETQGSGRSICARGGGQNLPPDRINPDGTSATVCAWFSVIGYNTDLVKPEEAPKSYADLLDPKWKGKIVKGHPGYSGAILTATYQISRDLGWSYFEKLAQQKVMQVQSAAEPPRKIAAGERAVQADGNDYSLALYKDAGRPVEIVYASEGTPQIIVETGIFGSAPNPNAARLFQHFLFSVEGQQIFIDFAHRSFHAQVKDRPGRTPLSAIKAMKGDPAAVEAQSEEIKARYTKIFGV